MEELRTMAFRDILERCEDNENLFEIDGGTSGCDDRVGRCICLLDGRKKRYDRCTCGLLQSYPQYCQTVETENSHKTGTGCGNRHVLGISAGAD